MADELQITGYPAGSVFGAVVYAPDLSVAGTVAPFPQVGTVWTADLPAGLNVNVLYTVKFSLTQGGNTFEVGEVEMTGAGAPPPPPPLDSPSPSLSLTFGVLKHAAEAAAGENVLKGPYGLNLLVNRALEYFYTCYEWTWRKRFSLLSLTHGSSQVLLPVDFGEMVDLRGHSLPYIQVQPNTPDAIARIRVYNIPDPYYLAYCVGGGPVLSSDGVPYRVLEIAPTPAADTLDALTLCYRVAVPRLVNDADTVPLPAGLHGAMYQTARYFATLEANRDPKLIAFQKETMDQMLATAYATDARSAGSVMGVIRGAVDQQSNRPYRPFSSIKMPGDP